MFNKVFKKEDNDRDDTIEKLNRDLNYTENKKKRSNKNSVKNSFIKNGNLDLVPITYKKDLHHEMFKPIKKSVKSRPPTIKPYLP